jgi:3,4-dihydroxy-9,10-secoandrosta-1,3,5(10)-triene-9,17-dione 4,5-dioxygenase
MDIRGLGYIDITARDTEAWRRYATTLGMMPVDSADSLRLRIDERPFRVMVTPTDGAEGLAIAGWEFADATALDEAVDQLRSAGRTVRPGSAADARARGVRGLVRTTDPGGFELELFHGPILDHVPFVSPAGVSRFVTDGLGFGHIVLGTPNMDEMFDFYTNLLGFRVSDYWRPGDEDIVFLHCNARHHSLALVPAEQPALYHFMLEAATLDDVGAALQRIHDSGAPISMDLGKHPNDEMVSFYSASPSGFDVEFGFGGRLIDDATWTVGEITKPSLWGHRSPQPSS